MKLMEPIILTPFHYHIDHQTEQCLRAAESNGFRVWRSGGISDPDQARIMMANQALKWGYDELIWVDSDMGFEVHDLNRLRQSGKSVISGVCVQKNVNNQVCFHQSACTNLKDEITEVDFVGAGFLYTRAEVYREIEKSLQFCQTRWGWQYPYFLSFINDEKILLPEDYAFCHHAKKAGFKIHIHTGVRPNHYGRMGFKWYPELKH